MDGVDFSDVLHFPSMRTLFLILPGRCLFSHPLPISSSMRAFRQRKWGSPRTCLSPVLALSRGAWAFKKMVVSRDLPAGFLYALKVCCVSYRSKDSRSECFFVLFGSAVLTFFSQHLRIIKMHESSRKVPSMKSSWVGFSLQKLWMCQSHL